MQYTPSLAKQGRVGEGWLLILFAPQEPAKSTLSQPPASHYAGKGRG